MTALLSLRGGVLGFTDVVLSNINIEIHDGDRIHLSGESGTGKSTLLMALAALHPLRAGIRLVDGQHDGQVTPLRVQVAMADSEALPNHLSVEQVVIEPLQAMMVADDRMATAHAMLTHFQVPKDAWQRHPRSLSGGQRQRVVLARACVLQPSVLLLDEPLRGADVLLAREMTMTIEAMPWLQAVVWAHHGDASWLPGITQRWRLALGGLSQPGPQRS